MKQKSKFHFCITHDVTWGEMDALGHVNNAQYFTYFENVRVAYFRSLGFKAISADDETGPILAQISCDFRQPITFPDKLTIGVGITRIGNSSIQLDYDIYSVNEDSIVAEGKSVVVLINYRTGKSIPFTEEDREKIKAVEPDFN